MATKLICDRCGAEINPKSSVTYAGMRKRKNDMVEYIKRKTDLGGLEV